MANTISDNAFNITPYLMKHSYTNGTNGNSSQINNFESVVDNNNSIVGLEPENHQENLNLLNDINSNSLKYESGDGYNDVYSPTNILYNQKYKSVGNDGDDYKIINTANYYLGGINGYNTNFNSHDDKLSTEDIAIYNANLNMDYRDGDSKFPITHEIYSSKDSKYPLEQYNGSYVGYGAGNYYSTDAKLKYLVYNMGQYTNSTIPIDNNSITTDNNLGAGNGTGVCVGLGSGVPAGLGLSVAATNQYIGQYTLSNQNNKEGNTANFNNSNSNTNNYYGNPYEFEGFNSNNSISGVKYQRTDNRWIARWTTAQGKRACKSFSVNIYGFDQAKMLAIQARQKGVALSGRSFCNRERQHAMKSGVGIIGIRFDKTQARWVSSYYEGGKRKFRYFTVKDYGYEQAKRNAIIWKSCNDERLLKKFNDNYSYNIPINNSNSGMGQQYTYPINLKTNEGDNNYLVDNSGTNDMYYPNNGNGYMDPNDYNTYTSNTEYSNGSNFSHMSNFSTKDNYSTDINGNYVMSDFPQNYGDEYTNKSTVDFQIKTDYTGLPVSDYRILNENDNTNTNNHIDNNIDSVNNNNCNINSNSNHYSNNSYYENYDTNNNHYYANYDSTNQKYPNYDKYDVENIGTVENKPHVQLDDKYLMWDKEKGQSYLPSADEMRFNYNKMYQMDENDGFTNTTIGSDNGDNKSNGSFDLEDHFNQSEIDQEYMNVEQENGNEINEPSEVIYDRKKGRWITTIIDSDGKKQSTYFPVSRHGYKKAKQLALSAVTELKEG